MNYQEINPPSYLKNVVRYFWTLETDGNSMNSTTFRIMADICPGLIYHQGGSGFAFDGQESGMLPPLFLYGQTTRAENLYSSGAINTVGVIFFPHVLKVLFGFDADEITDEVIDVNLIQPGITDKLQQADSTVQQIELLSSLIADQLEQNIQTDWSIWNSIKQIGRGKGNIPVQKLHKTLHLSERQFERRFKQQVGITAKRFSRIVRFQSALNQIHAKNYKNLSDIAYETGYSDQSHFIREFKEFAGLKPGQYHTQNLSFICQNHDKVIART